MKWYWRFSSVPELEALPGSHRRRLLKLAHLKLRRERGMDTFVWLSIVPSAMAGGIAGPVLLRGIWERDPELIGVTLGALIIYYFIATAALRPFAIRRIRPAIREILISGA